MDTIAFIGGGNMASAIVGGLVAAGHPAQRLVVVEPNEAQRKRLVDRFGVRALAAADASLAESGVVVWAVKPQMFQAAAAPCRERVGAALHLSVMAGIRSDTIALAVASERIVRAMPNTPAAVRQGITVATPNAHVTPEQRALCGDLLSAIGLVEWVDDEALLDPATAVSGSGPAYVFLLAELMEQAAIEQGIAPDLARILARQTVAGSGALLAASTESAADLRKAVTSPQGTTEAALKVLMAPGAMPAALSEAIAAATIRSRELAG